VRQPGEYGDKLATDTGTCDAMRLAYSSPEGAPPVSLRTTRRHAAQRSADVANPPTLRTVI